MNIKVNLKEKTLAICHYTKFANFPAVQYADITTDHNKVILDVHAGEHS